MKTSCNIPDVHNRIYRICQRNEATENRNGPYDDLTSQTPTFTPQKKQNNGEHVEGLEPQLEARLHHCLVDERNVQKSCVLLLLLLHFQNLLLPLILSSQIVLFPLKHEFVKLCNDWIRKFPYFPFLLSIINGCDENQNWHQKRPNYMEQRNQSNCLP